MKEILLVLLIISPLVTIIHELGHITAVKIFKHELSRVRIGSGKSIFSIGKVSVGMFFFHTGSFHYKRGRAHHPVQKIIIMLAGPLANLMTALIAYAIMINFEMTTFIRNIVLNDFFILSIYMTVINLLPVSFGKTNTDGKQILDLLRSGESKYLKEKYTK